MKRTYRGQSLEIVEWPAKVLETPAKPVVKFDDEFTALVNHMFEIMNEANGIGLAANQVGVLERLLVISIPFNNHECSDDVEDEAEKKLEKRPWHDKKFCFVNPKIVERKGRISYQEGCLSFPEIFDFVDRAAEIVVEAQDEKGKPIRVEADGLFSVCLQHEIDHIDGIVFINRMSRFKSERIRKKILRRGRLSIAETEE